jgi:hypothetical protein
VTMVMMMKLTIIMVVLMMIMVIALSEATREIVCKRRCPLYKHSLARCEQSRLRDKQSSVRNRWSHA